jgi:hypothetical protein
MGRVLTLAKKITAIKKPPTKAVFLLINQIAPKRIKNTKTMQKKDNKNSYLIVLNINNNKWFINSLK